MIFKGFFYLGITNNSDRRIRQHNNIIKGGAKYTHAKKGDGEWVYHLKITNLTKSEALSMERTAKNLRKKAKSMPFLSNCLNFSLHEHILGGMLLLILFFIAKYSEACGSVKNTIVLALNFFELSFIFFKIA